MSKLKTQLINIADIKPSPDNIRIVTKNAVKAVKKSVERYGYNVPLILDQSLTIVAGHTRYQALKHLAVEAVTCIILDETDPKVLDQIRILDNHIGEQSDWDVEKLGLELRYIYSGAGKTDWKDLNLIFPDTKLLDKALDASLGKQVATVTATQVAKTQDTLDNKFKERAAIKMMHVNCPNCGREVKVKDNL